MARTGAEPLGVDGHRHADRRAVGAAAAAVRLLPAAVRPGHQPAARRHPRGARHVARRRRIGPEGNLLDAGPGVVPPARRCRSRSSTTTSSPRSSTSTTTATARVHGRHGLAGLYRVAGGGDGAARGARRDLRARSSAAIDRRRPASSCSPTATPTRSGRRSRRCCSPSARAPPPHPREAPARRSGSSSRPATPARCTTWRCCIGYGAGAINPYLALESIEDLIAERRRPRRSRPQEAVKQLHQGARQGRAEGDVEDGHLHGRVLHAARRSSRPSASATTLVDEYFTGTASQLGGIGLDVIAAEVAARHAHGVPDRPDERAAPRASSSAASTSGAARASRTCSTPRPCSSCSTPPAPSRYDIFKEYTALVDDQSAELDDAARAVRASRPGGARPVPIDEVEPVADDRQALLHRRDVATARSRRRRTRPSRSR